MAIRKIAFAPGEFFHVYNRGMQKQPIFKNDADRWRFLFSLLHFQSDLSFDNISELVPFFLQHRMLKRRSTTQEIIDKRVVSLQAFSLMPNHFHLLIKETGENGISRYLQRIQNSYTKYFNTKHEKSGHLFQGPFKAVHVADNEQLLYLSAYIHRNCCELKLWQNRPSNYPWSSYQDYIGKNRWEKLLDTEIIKEQFDSPRDYDNWVRETEAKTATSDVAGFIGAASSLAE